MTDPAALLWLANGLLALLLVVVGVALRTLMQLRDKVAIQNGRIGRLEERLNGHEKVDEDHNTDFRAMAHGFQAALDRLSSDHTVTRESIHALRNEIFRYLLDKRRVSDATNL